MSISRPSTASRRDLLPAFHREQHALVIFRRSDAVDARNARDHDDVAAREQRARRGKSQALDLLVNRRILLDVSVGARNVGFRLVVIEVADEIFDGVVREELFELGVELRRERLVVRDDQRRPVEFADHIGDRESLSRTGHAEKRLMPISGLDRFDQLGDRLRPDRRAVCSSIRAETASSTMAQGKESNNEPDFR